jgi:hypothetical protein
MLLIADNYFITPQLYLSHILTDRVKTMRKLGALIVVSSTQIGSIQLGIV